MWAGRQFSAAMTHEEMPGHPGAEQARGSRVKHLFYTIFYILSKFTLISFRLNWLFAHFYSFTSRNFLKNLHLFFNIVEYYLCTCFELDRHFSILGIFP